MASSHPRGPALASFPPEILQLITVQLEYYDLVNLCFLAGDVVLNSKLLRLGGITEVRIWSQKSLAILKPRRVLSLPFTQLKVLRIDNEQRFIGPYPLLGIKLPPSLEEIYFYFMNSVEAFLRPVNLDIDDDYVRFSCSKLGHTCDSLQDTLPQLRVLHCRGKTSRGRSHLSFAFFHHFFHHLPATLTSLHMTLPISSQLHALLLPMTPVLAKIHDLRLESWFDSALKCLLFLRSQDTTTSFSQYPFELSRQYRDWTPSGDDVSASRKESFDSLVKLHCHVNTDESCVRYLSHFQNLEYLDLRWTLVNPGVENFKGIEALRKLTSLSLSSVPLSSFDDLAFIRHLPLASLHLQPKSLAFNSMPQLPPSLTHLSLSAPGVLFDLDTPLPPSVSSVAISAVLLTSQTVETLSKNKILALRWSGSFPLSTVDLEKFPFLTSLEMHTNVPLHPADLASLPKSLSRLKCAIKITQEVLQEATVWNQAVALETIRTRYFPLISPESLKIDLSMDPVFLSKEFPNCNITHYDFQASINPNRRLRVLPDSLLSLSSLSISNAIHVCQLPPNLTQLTALKWHWLPHLKPGPKSFATGPRSAIQTLPPTLRSITIDTGSIQDPKFGNASFHIPLLYVLPALETLCIESVRAPDFSMISDLPRSLTDLTLGLRVYADVFFPMYFPQSAWPPALRRLRLPLTRTYLSSFKTLMSRLDVFYAKEVWLTDDVMVHMQSNSLDPNSAHLLSRFPLTLQHGNARMKIKIEWSPKALNYLPPGLLQAEFWHAPRRNSLSTITPVILACALPATLTKLNLGKKKSPIPASFPPNLTELAMPLSNLSPDADFSSFPSSLVSATLYAFPLPRFTKAKISSLPRGLKSLTLYVQGSAPEGGVEGGLAALPALLVLRIKGRTLAPFTTLQKLALLPSSLVTLVIKTRLSSEALEKLPTLLPNLRYFGMSCDRNLIVGSPS